MHGARRKVIASFILCCGAGEKCDSGTRVVFVPIAGFDRPHIARLFIDYKVEFVVRVSVAVWIKQKSAASNSQNEQ